MVTDPIADSLIRIKNGYLAGKKTVSLSGSKIVQGICDLLVREGYLESAAADSGRVVVGLKYTAGSPVITDLAQVSRPSLRIYVNKKNLPTVLGGKGISVISTPKGLMTDGQARKQGLGGEVVFKIW